MKYFGQEVFEFSEATSGNLSDPVYIAASQFCLQRTRGEGIDKLLANDKLDQSSPQVPKLQRCYIERRSRRISKYLGTGRLEGDLLDKPVDHGGLAFSRYSASGILPALIVACILFLPQNQKAGSHPGQYQRAS